jgi:tungstate transport system substrate-binding protein
MRKPTGSLLICAFFALLVFPACKCKQEQFHEAGPAASEKKQEAPEAKKDVILATTTSTQDTGLLDVLVPLFEKKTGYAVKTIAVGSGQAMAMGRRGEADVLLVHSPEDEEAFVNEGFGVHRRIVMHNDFVLVGPPGDGAKVKGEKSIAVAFKKIASAGAVFVSRADKSGTHVKELAIWKEAGADPGGQSWYLETGTGMGQTLSVASEKDAYTLSDRGTYLALKKNLHLVVLVEGDATLLNVYHVIQVNTEKFPAVNGEGAKALADFIVSGEAQGVIGTFGVEKYGAALFHPDAGPAAAAGP